MTNPSADPQDPGAQTPSLGLLRDLINEVRLAWRLLLDPRVPIWLKFVPPLTMLYVLSPIDLVPGLLFPVVGQLDDVAALILGFRSFISLSPPAIVQEHRLAIAGAGAPPPPATTGPVIDGAFREVNPRDPQTRP